MLPSCKINTASPVEKFEVKVIMEDTACSWLICFRTQIAMLQKVGIPHTYSSINVARHNGFAKQGNFVELLSRRCSPSSKLTTLAGDINLDHAFLCFTFSARTLPRVHIISMNVTISTLQTSQHPSQRPTRLIYRQLPKSGMSHQHSLLFLGRLNAWNLMPQNQSDIAIFFTKLYIFDRNWQD